MSDRATPMELLFTLLVSEEKSVLALVALAREEQAALVASDYERIEAVTERMVAEAERLETLERQRDVLLDTLGCPDGTLADIAELAGTSGGAGLETLRMRLLDAADELRSTQESNARLILAAAKLRERWFSMLAGMVSPTYGAEGRRQLQQERRFVSKSA